MRVVLEISGAVEDPQGLKEKLAMDFEKYGDVRVVSVTGSEPEQLKLEGT